MSKVLVSSEVIQNKIYLIRGQKVMLDRDLAELYGVPAKVLNQAVRRNLERFPIDFMFQLTKEESMFSRSQFVTLKRGANIKYLPYVFTEHGILMLSSVLNSHRAIEVNIAIMRAFVKLRELMLTHKDLARKIEALEKKFQAKFKDHDEKFVLIFDAIKQLLSDKEETAKKKGPLGFVPPKK